MITYQSEVSDYQYLNDLGLIVYWLNITGQKCVMRWSDGYGLMGIYIYADFFLMIHFEK